jgi:hypothetical protein
LGTTVLKALMVLPQMVLPFEKGLPSNMSSGSIFFDASTVLDTKKDSSGMTS